MQPLYAMSLQSLGEIFRAITNFFEESAVAFVRSLDFAALFTWITVHAVFIIGAILLALWFLGTFRKSP
jgi:hypothetical protein